MKKIVLLNVLIVTFVLSLVLVSAISSNIKANANVGVEKNNKSESNNSNGIGNELNQLVRAKITELKEGNYTGPLGQLLNVKQISANLRELRSNGISAKTELNITAEEDNGTKFKAHLSNGQESEIKIMPDRASETAIAKLKLNACSEENNCTIELKEVGNNNEIKTAYDVKAKKPVKVFGLFRAKMNVEANVDAETGEVISSKVPWWSSISTEDN